MPSSLRPGFSAHIDEKQSAKLHLRISQETFDAAVLENVEDLEMEPVEALADAVQQFESQGVNLSNIIQRVPGAAPEEDPLAVRLVRDIVAALDEAEEEESVEIAFGGGKMKMSFMRVTRVETAAALGASASELRAELQRNKEALTLAGHNGGVDALVSAALALMQSPSALPPILEALAVLLMDAENREQLGVRGVAALFSVVRTHGGEAAAVRAALHAVRAAMLVHEHYRGMLVGQAGILKLAVACMEQWEADTPTFLAACGVVRTSTLADDARARTSKGLEHAKAAVELGVLPLLLRALQSDKASTPTVLAEMLATLSRLTVTDKICSQLADMDALRLAITELGNHVTDAAVAKQACFFLANISGNDQCKGSIVHGHGHVAIIQAMHLHPNNGGMQTDAVSALGNMCLRMPLNCEAIAEAGGLAAIATAFTQHLHMPRMQSKGCLAIRNLTSRNHELIEPLLALGVEQPLRAVLAADPDSPSHNLAKAALRELHCSVHLKEGFKGEIGAAFSLDQGEVDCENHWDKFLETPVAQEAMRQELEAMGVQPEQ